ncbi:MAG: hypothetical protein H6581_20650 [Bacteroidia bacterium]|nr:hypothetical protein [Bacteroidia bacterium]
MAKTNKQPFYKNPWVLGGGIALAVGTAGYFIFSGNGKDEKSPGNITNQVDLDLLLNQSGSSPSPKPTVPASTVANDSFPLRFGSKGLRVKQLQQALIKAYGPSILPKWKDDGDWGNETQTALSSKGWPTLYNSQAELDAAMQKSAPGNSSRFNPELVAKTIRNAINSKNLSSFTITKDQLILLKSPSDYKAVSDSLQTGTILGVRRNLVNALVGDSMPWPVAAKTYFKGELTRMGLEYDAGNDRWSLPALGFVSPQIAGRRLISATNATVWDGNKHLFEVPPGLYLGVATRQENGVTEFLTSKDRKFYAQSNSLSVV